MIFHSFRKRNSSQKDTNNVYFEYSYSGIVPKERSLTYTILVNLIYCIDGNALLTTNKNSSRINITTTSEQERMKLHPLLIRDTSSVFSISSLGRISKSSKIFEYFPKIIRNVCATAFGNSWKLANIFITF